MRGTSRAERFGFGKRRTLSDIGSFEPKSIDEGMVSDMKRGMMFLTISALLTACGDPAFRWGEELRVEVETVGVVVQVRNVGDGPEWRFERVLRLGAVEGGPEEFGRIRSLVADGDRNVYVADNLAHEVRVFGPDGSHLRSIGRRGEGPGEFGSLYSLSWLGEDLIAMDPGNARLAILSREGDWRGSIQSFPITGPASLIRLHSLGSMGFYAPVIDPDRFGLQFASVLTAGGGDTIPAPRPPQEANSTGVLCHRPDGGITSISLPEAPAIVYGFPPPGGVLAVSWTDQYRVQLVGPSGDTTRAVVREGPRVLYPDSLWDQGIRPYRELREEFPGAQCEPSSPERPRYRAALRHLLFDESGRLWVEAAVEGGFVWEVFDAEGRLRGAAPAPPRAPGIPPYARDGHLYQVEVDEMDVQFVAVYRLTDGV